MKVKNWFMNKNFDEAERIAISASPDPIVEKETEKAVLLKWNTEYGIIKSWIPKSCLCEEADNSDNAVFYDKKSGKSVSVSKDNTVMTKATTKDGRTLEVLSDNGAVVKLSDGKVYAKFMLRF